MMDAVSMAMSLCVRFEGLYTKPYLCPAGVPTIGYGATFYEDGTAVSMTDAQITQHRAMRLLRWHLEAHFLPQVVQLCPGAEKPGQVAALLDFAFNCGIGNLRASTLRRRVNVGMWSDVPAQFRRWNKAGGRVLRGLTLRREAEIDLLEL